MNQLIGYLSEGEQLKGSLTIPQQLGGSTLGSKTITANGVYDATDDGVDGYDVVTANVPNTYAAGDEGKVVDNGALVSQTTATYTINNTYDTTKIKSVTVNVGGGSPTLETITKTYTPSTSQQTETITPSSGYDGIGEVDVTVNAIPSQYIIPTGTKSISSNGTGIDVKAYEYADVAVPNSYSAADEGKVVSSGALVAQTAHADVTPTASDQTIDTTTNNSIKVNGDANLVAGNIKKDVVIFNTTGTYEGGGGGGLSLDDFFNGTAPVGAVSLPTATKLYGYSFYNHALITSLTAPNLTRLGECDFVRCSELTDVYMPELLYACTTLKADNLIGNADNCFSFQNCDKLGNINFPKFLTAGKGMFWQAGHNSNTYNAVLVLPSVTQFGHSACRQAKFKAVDLGPNLTTLNSDTFYNATIDVLILRSSTLVSAGNRDAVRNVKNLYVPSALVSSYATASNWAADAASRTVTAIEGSQYENYYADGTLIPT